MNNNAHFAVYKHRLIIKDNKLVSRQFIVLKHKNDTLQFTDFHRYVKSPVRKVKKYTDDGNNRFSFVVQLLNYAFFYAKIEKLDDITVEIIDDFLNAYGMCELPWDNDNTKRSESTVKRCVRTIMDFIEIFIDERKEKCCIKKHDLFKYENKRDKHGKVLKVKVPVFDVIYIGNQKAIFRDIPNEAFQILFNHILTNHQEILGLIMLSAFAGLRPSEACNVRRTDSSLGAGIMFEIVDGEIMKIEIDIREELNLRSDLISVGNIKKERMQPVPDIFLNAFKETYDKYMEYLKGRYFEKDYGAFTLNKQGKALTYFSYRQKFQKIIQDEIIPIYLASENPELVLYGRILMENKLSPHVFRHWFTVQLVLSGISEPGTLMYWRGDSSPESSLDYLKNKGELMKQYQRVNNEVFNYMLWASKRKYDD